MIALRGHYRAVGVMLSLPRANAAAMLTSNCELDQQPLPPCGNHPVVLLMGEHSDVQMFGLPFRIAYRETLVAVPWVRHRGTPCGSRPLAHVSRLWLNRLLPTIGGWAFGFPKQRDRISWTEGRYSIRTLIGGAALLDAAFEDHGTAGPVSQYPNFAAIRPVFEQPFIQRLFLAGPTCVEVLDFHLEQATLQPVQAHIEIEQAFMPSIPAGTYDFKPIDVVPLGAFQIQLPWTLTAPSRCSSLPMSAPNSSRAVGGMPRKIAVLGGGCGSMAAVWALTQLPNWRDRFDITVHQIGWRLGGKCASGRDEKNAWRIYEHGLHIWGGFYQNAFRFVQQVYAALPPDPSNPLFKWDDAFKKVSNIILQENINGRIINWEIDISEDNDVPGTDGVMPSVWDYIVRIVNEIRSRISRHVPPPAKEELTEKVRFALTSLDTDTGGSIFPRIFRDLGEALPNLTPYQVLDILDSAQLVAKSVPAQPPESFTPRLNDLLYLTEQASRLFVDRHTVPDSDFSRRAKFILDFLLATMRGIFADGVIWHGWEAINDREWSAWLSCHGAAADTLSSALVRGIYDYVFGFVKGQPNNRQVEAGVGTHGVLRLFFTWKGAIFWEMQAGMGDVVFAPLYRVLKDRGVKFEFFSKVKKLVVKNNAVESIELDQQATVTSGEYDPLVIVGGVHAWPAHPRYEQLDQGAQLRNQNIDLESHWTPWKGTDPTLQRGPDFDDVILGISIGALSDIAGDVAAANSAFKTMLAKVQTVATHSMQLWLDGHAQRLGAPMVRRCATAAAEPIATWCDMSYLLQREQWPPTQAPLYLAYFCGELDDVGWGSADPPQFMLQHFRKIAVDWLKNNTGAMWSRAILPGTQCLDWSLLHDPQNRAGETRLDAQYLRVNINPSDRYVASFPDTGRFRLPADKPVLKNLYITGDWVKTPINAGCVEAAVMAGLYAARAVSGDPIKIIGG